MRTTSFAAATGPAFRAVARHMFKLYDDDGRVYCVSCDRVMAATRAQLESHFRSCDHGGPGTTAAQRQGGDDGRGSGRTYVCGACDVTTGDPDRWTHHFGTADHWRRYAASPRYVYACAECDVTLYDTEDAIELHAWREHRGRGRVPAADRFMATVYAALASSRAAGVGRDAIHCCVGCRTVCAAPVHADPRPGCGGRHAETFYCGTCRATVVCDAPTYGRLHRTAPEHAAMAVRDDVHAEDAAPRTAWTLVVGGARGPGRRADDGACRACRLCGDRLPSRPGAASLHALRCPALTARRPQPARRPSPPPAGKSSADYDAFRCGVCRVTVAHAAAWAAHLSSVAAHAVTPHRMAVRAYYECPPCRTLYYGPRDRLRDVGHRCCDDGSEHRFRPVGPVADLMRYVYRDVNSPAADDDDYDDDDGGGGVSSYGSDGSSYGDGERSSYGDGGSSYGSRSRHRHNYCYYYEQNAGRYGRCDRSAEPAAVPFYCPTCRLEFYGSRAAFRQHALTAEHVLIELFATARPTTKPEAGRVVVTPVLEYAGEEEHSADGDRWTVKSQAESPGLDAVATICGSSEFVFALPDFQELHDTFSPSLM